MTSPLTVARGPGLPLFNQLGKIGSSDMPLPTLEEVNESLTDKRYQVLEIGPAAHIAKDVSMWPVRTTDPKPPGPDCHGLLQKCGLDGKGYNNILVQGYCHEYVLRYTD